MSAAAARWGPTVATAYAAASVRHPRRMAVIDPEGSVSFRQLEVQSTRLARGFRGIGLKAGQRLGDSLP